MTRHPLSGFPLFTALAVLTTLSLLAPEAALASTTGGAGLPWEAPLQNLVDSLTGPVAYAISLLGVVVAGIVLVFGGEVGDFVRRIFMLVLVISLLAFATQVLSQLFGFTGAVV